MSFTSGPYPLTLGSPVHAINPAFGSGNVTSQGAVVKNISPFLLEISSGSGSLVALIDPYTTDLVPLDAESGQELTIAPSSIGLVPPPTVNSEVFVTWFQTTETIPGHYPYAMPLSSSIAVGGIILASASEIAVLTAATSVVTFTPGAAGNFRIGMYFRVSVATTNVSITVTWTDPAGAQSLAVLNAVPETVGSYPVTDFFIYASAAAITVSMTAGTANQVIASASINQA